MYIYIYMLYIYIYICVRVCMTTVVFHKLFIMISRTISASMINSFQVSLCPSIKQQKLLSTP